jgi:RNA polymerase-binding transcription factor DksA
MVREIAEFERTPDENERATLIEAHFTDVALEAAREKTRPQSHPNFDGEHCVDCADPIPPERLAFGRVRCVACQEIIEREARCYRQNPVWMT